MKAELTGDGHELVITLNTAELPVAASDGSLRARLPEHAGPLADAIMGMLAEPPDPGEPRAVRVVHIRLVRTQVVAETVLELPGPREVYA